MKLPTYLIVLISLVFFISFSSAVVDCLESNPDNICKSSCSTGRHEIIADCSSVSSTFKCCALNSGTNTNIGVPLGKKCFPDATNLCKSAYSRDGYFYCDILQVVNCPLGCDTSLNVCKGDNQVPECTNGYMKCLGGDSYKCINQVWIKTASCAGTCKNPSYNYAFCDNLPTYYCLRPDRDECYISTSKLSNCYDNENQCHANNKVWCINKETKTCNLRTGIFEDACLAGETPHQGTDLTTHDKCMALLEDILKSESFLGDLSDSFGSFFDNSQFSLLGDFWDSIKWFLLIGLVILALIYFQPLLVSVMRIFK